MTIQEDFHRAMLAIYDQCSAIGYRPRDFRRMVLQYKGVEAAKLLIHKPETSGLARLAALGRLDLSMEMLMLTAPYTALFTEQELNIARLRLKP